MGCCVKPVTAIFHGRKAGTRGLLEQKVRLLNYCLHLQWIMSELYKYMTCQWFLDVLLAFRKETSWPRKITIFLRESSTRNCSWVTRGGQRPSLGMNPSTTSPTTAAVGDTLERQLQRWSWSFSGTLKVTSCRNSFPEAEHAGGDQQVFVEMKPLLFPQKHDGTCMCMSRLAAFMLALPAFLST